MEDVHWLSNLKIRSSYGATGNNKIEPFSYLELLNIANYAFGAGTGTLGSGLAANNDVLPNMSLPGSVPSSTMRVSMLVCLATALP